MKLPGYMKMHINMVLLSDEIDVTGYIFEPWHITYVGKEIAQTMHDEKITTLEEYVVKYVDHKKP